MQYLSSPEIFNIKDMLLYIRLQNPCSNFSSSHCTIVNERIYQYYILTREIHIKDMLLYIRLGNSCSNLLLRGFPIDLHGKQNNSSTKII
jgi:hypothetical protein